MFWSNISGSVASAGAHIAQFLSLARLYYQVTGLIIFADDHSFVHLLRGINKEDPTILQFVQGICRSHASFFGNEHSVISSGYCTLPWFVFTEAMVHYRFPGRACKHLCAQTNQSS